MSTPDERRPTRELERFRHALGVGTGLATLAVFALAFALHDGGVLMALPVVWVSLLLLGGLLLLLGWFEPRGEASLARLGAELGFTVVGPGRLEGRHDERGCSVVLLESHADPDVKIARLSVRAGDPQPFGLTRDAALGWGFASKPRRPDEPRLDERSRLPGAVVDAAHAFRASHALRVSGSHFFDSRFVEQIGATGDAVVVDVPLAKLTPSACGDVLGFLSNLARDLERVAVPVAALGAPRKALVARAGGVGRCAYCHEDVSGSELDLTACRTCGTILHEACWVEHGRCPVLGCPGREPERARTTGS